MGKQLVCDVTVVDALASSRLNQGFSCNPGTTATEAEARKKSIALNWEALTDNGYIFQPVALDVQGYLVESSEFFIACLCKMPCRSHDDQRAGSFLKQRISMALQIGNAACVLGNEWQRCVRRNLLHFIWKKTYHCSFFKKFYRSTAIVAGMSSLLIVLLLVSLLLLFIIRASQHVLQGLLPK